VVLTTGAIRHAKFPSHCHHQPGLATFTHVVLTMVKTPVKTGLGKTTKTHMSWAKLGKTKFLNSKNAS